MSLTNLFEESIQSICSISLGPYIPTCLAHTVQKDWCMFHSACWKLPGTERCAASYPGAVKLGAASGFQLSSCEVVFLLVSYFPNGWRCPNLVFRFFLIPVVFKTVGLPTVGTRQGSVERAVEFLSAQ